MFTDINIACDYVIKNFVPHKIITDTNSHIQKNMKKYHISTIK